mgnify:CR=1 FL=1
MGVDRDGLAFGIGLPIGALIVGALMAAPVARRVTSVAVIVLFATVAYLVGLNRLIEVLADALDQYLALRWFSSGTVAGGLITLMSWPRPPRSGKLGTS